jgi:hypothetical protein
LRTLDFSQLHRERLELEQIAREMMVFLAFLGQAEVLLNSLKSNYRMLQERLADVGLDGENAPHYAWQVRRLERASEQIALDLSYAQATLQSVRPIQDIQRGIETMRMGRASVLLGGAAAVLAGITIFNSFLDIWDLAVKESGLEMPAPWWRATLGALAAISWPLGAYWAVERRMGRAVIALGVGVAAVILAVASMMLVN